MEILVVTFIHLAGFREGTFCRKSPISTGRKGRIQPGKLLNPIGHIENRPPNQDSFRYHYTDIRGAAVLQTPGLFVDQPSTFEKQQT